MGKNRLLLVLSLLIIVGSVGYYPSFEAAFVFDDLRVIVKDRDVHVKEFSLESLQSLIRKKRPVAVLSFAVNYYFGGLKTFGYHLVNLIIHILTAFIVYLFIDATLNLPSLRQRWGDLAHPAALACGLVFVAHPVNTQSVTYVVQRMASLATLLFMASMFFYVKGRTGKNRWGFYLLSGISGLLALGTKENVATLPVFIGIYEVYFFHEFEWDKIKRNLAYFTGLIILPIAIGAYYIGEVLSLQTTQRFTMGEKLLTELRVLVYYISLLLFPHPSRLNLDYDFPLSHSLFNPVTTFWALLVFLGMLFLIIYSAKKKPLISFGIIWFLGNLAIESTVAPVELIYEHRLYLPAIGFFLAMISLFFIKTESWNKLPAFRKKLHTGILVLIVIILSYWTYQRNLVWRDSMSLWTDVAKKNPASGRVQDNLALAYFRIGDYDRAVQGHLRSIELGGPGLIKKFNNLGNAYFKSKLYDKALAAYKRAVELDPKFVEAHNGLGVSYNAKKMYEQAERELLRVIELDPWHPGAHSNLGMVYYNRGAYAKSAAAYRRALERNALDVKNHYGLAGAYAKQGLYDKAVDEYRKVLAVDPRNAKVYNSLGSVYANKKMYQEAKKAFEKALSINNNFFEARKHLGNVYYLLKENDRAIAEWEKALAINPRDKVVLKNLKIVRRKRKQ